MLRSPICSVLGHVDHGKSSILDSIRGTSVVSGEAGAITQAIGASIIPLETIRDKCGPLLESLKMELTIPGLLFIDTPGHAAFTSLRKRGGTLADIAVLVIDINEGFKPQTIEAIEILRANKTPFVIAANKTDLTPGWRPAEKQILQNIQEQSQDTKAHIDQRLYEIVGQLHDNFQINAERFDRVDDFTKQIAIVPCSAKTGEGLPELIMVVTGLAQRFLEGCLKCDTEGPAKGSIMEMKDEKGLGKTADVIIYDGTLKVNDTIIIGGVNEPIVTKVRALFEPAPLSEMREKKSRFVSVKKATAATGVKISAPEIEKSVAGMPVMAAASEEDVAELKQRVQEEVAEVLMETERNGVVVKADNIGSLEAMLKLLNEKEIPIMRASLGNITKKDIADAESNFENNPLHSVILGFNVSVPDDVHIPSSVKIITNDIIYSIIDSYEKWSSEASRNIEKMKLDVLVRPCRIKVLGNYIFRQSNPAIVGVDITAGTLKTGMPLMSEDGKEITEVKTIQHEKENVSSAGKGKQVAVSMPGVTVGRQIDDGSILYSAVPENDFRKLKDLKQYLTDDETEAIKEIARIKRKNNPVWGV
ncbi:MAG: translation initiation factor IF-2 [Candidatus Woesearchaeota archaeon]